MHTVDREIDENPHALHEAPLTAPVSRPDEARAARDLRARWHSNHHTDAHESSLAGPEGKPSI